MQHPTTQPMQSEINRLRRVIVHQEREITRLKNIINYRALDYNVTPMSIECVIHHVCTFYNMSVEALVEKNREGERVVARMAVCWIANRRYKHTFKSIGIKLAHRDHSTIMNACDKADEFLSTNKAFKRHIDMIINTIEHEFVPVSN